MKSTGTITKLKVLVNINLYHRERDWVLRNLTLMISDQITVLEQGHLVEKGTYNDLLSKENGTFRKLVQHQTFTVSDSWMCSVHIVSTANIKQIAVHETDFVFTSVKWLDTTKSWSQFKKINLGFMMALGQMCLQLPN